MTGIPPLPPAPLGWDKTIDDLFEEVRAGKRQIVGFPEVEWAREYERSRLPPGARFPTKGDIYRPVEDFQVVATTHWRGPYSGSCAGVLRAGERLLIKFEPIFEPTTVICEPLDYSTVEEGIVPIEVRRKQGYDGISISVKTADLISKFELVYSDR